MNQNHNIQHQQHYNTHHHNKDNNNHMNSHTTTHSNSHSISTAHTSLTSSVVPVSPSSAMRTSHFFRLQQQLLRFLSLIKRAETEELQQQLQLAQKNRADVRTSLPPVPSHMSAPITNQSEGYTHSESTIYTQQIDSTGEYNSLSNLTTSTDHTNSGNSSHYNNATANIKHHEQTHMHTSISSNNTVTTVSALSTHTHNMLSTPLNDNGNNTISNIDTGAAISSSSLSTSSCLSQ